MSIACVFPKAKKQKQKYRSITQNLMRHDILSAWKHDTHISNLKLCQLLDFEGGEMGGMLVI